MPISVKVPEGMDKESFSDAIMGLASPTPISYLANARVTGLIPGRKTLNIYNFEGEGQMDLFKFVKDIINNAKKFGYNKIEASPMVKNLKGGRSMSDMMMGAGGIESKDGEYVRLSIDKLEKLLSNKSYAKNWLESMKEIPRSELQWPKDKKVFGELSGEHSLEKSLLYNRNPLVRKLFGE